jgi:protein gp37
MAENTKIQWCDHTFNPWIGCTKVAEGCKFCYAEELMANRYKKVKWGPLGTRVRTKTWGDPVRWNKQADKEGVRKKVFCASLADVFEDRDELIPWRKDLFKLMDDTPNLDWLLLTKRPENIGLMWPLDGDRRMNVWLGTSISTQIELEEAAKPLIALKDLCAFTFLSLEPQIEAIDCAQDYGISIRRHTCEPRQIVKPLPGEYHPKVVAQVMSHTGDVSGDPATESRSSALPTSPTAPKLALIA